MTVRNATRFDIPAILDMLREYRSHTPLPFLAEADDAEYITTVLTELIAGRGCVLVSDDGGLTGMLIACIDPSAWSPKHLVMTEMAYWVTPSRRGSSAGYRLLREYVNRGNQLKEQGRIKAFFISKMTNSPDLQYGRFGFNKLEEFWVA